jgi:hypothetical protein
VLNFGAAPFLHPVAGFQALQAPPRADVLAAASYLADCLTRLVTLAAPSDAPAGGAAAGSADAPAARAKPDVSEAAVASAAAAAGLAWAALPPEALGCASRPAALSWDSWTLLGRWARALARYSRVSVFPDPRPSRSPQRSPGPATSLALPALHAARSLPTAYCWSRWSSS